MRRIYGKFNFFIFRINNWWNDYGNYHEYPSSMRYNNRMLHFRCPNRKSSTLYLFMHTGINDIHDSDIFHHISNWYRWKRYCSNPIGASNICNWRIIPNPNYAPIFPSIIPIYANDLWYQSSA